MEHTVEKLPPEIDDSMAQVIEETKLRMLHALEVFPFISPSMLHQAIGTATSTKLWRPLLDHLVEEGKVVLTEITLKTATGRMQSYAIYHLAKHAYTYNQG